MREQACQRALTRNRTLWGGGALQIGDLCRVEDGSKCSGALGSDLVKIETASEGQSRELREGVSPGVDRKANTLGRGALEVGDHRLLEDGSER